MKTRLLFLGCLFSVITIPSSAKNSTFLNDTIQDEQAIQKVEIANLEAGSFTQEEIQNNNWEVSAIVEEENLNVQINCKKLPSAQTYTFSIKNAQGHEVAYLNGLESRKVKLNVFSLPKGNYTYTVKTNDDEIVTMKKISVQ